MIGPRPTEVRLTLAPQRRFEAIDVNRRIAEAAGDVLRRHKRALYCSLHTTAGYLDPSLSARLRHNQDRLALFFRSFDALFPQGAEYHHDRMELRTELSDAQKVVEPRNADSHLTFIGAGLRNCVTYRTQPDAPVYFIDLDGAYERHAADADDRRARLRRRARGRADAGAHSGVEAPDRFGQPRRSAARSARAGERSAGALAAWSAAASIWRSPRRSATPGSP